MIKLIKGILLLAISALSVGYLSPLSSLADDAISIVSTTGMVADLVRNVGKQEVKVQSLMGPGVDPHLYKATQGDLKRLLSAEMIFYSGLKLEGKMADVLSKLVKKKPVVAVTSKLEDSKLLGWDQYPGEFDPHVWFDLKLWAQAVDRVLNALSDFRPAKAEYFANNASLYKKELSNLDIWGTKVLSEIPQRRRILITAHDAFKYFGRAYSIEVMGLQGVSTESEFGLQDLKRLTDVIIERQVKSIFVESSVPQRFVLALQKGVQARGHKIDIGGELFSDAMGEPSTPEGTYLGMFKHNVETIAKGLL